MPAAIEAWPDNRFTAGLPEPRGIPDYVIDDSGQGRFSVFYRQVDRSARQDWLEGLEGLGFERRVSASEPESENEPLGGRGPLPQCQLVRGYAGDFHHPERGLTRDCLPRRRGRIRRLFSRLLLTNGMDLCMLKTAI